MNQNNIIPNNYMMETKKLFSDMDVQILSTIIPYINKAYFSNSTEIKDFGIGKIGFDFSIPNEFLYLVVFYDALNDCFIIEYKKQNDIIDDIVLSICVDENDIGPIMAGQMKEEAIKDFKENHNPLGFQFKIGKGIKYEIPLTEEEKQQFKNLK